MTTRLVPLIGAVAILAACGGDSGRPSARDEVSAYIEQVNAIENGLRGPLRLAQSAVVGLSKKQRPATAARQLATAERTLRRLQARLGEMPSPQGARELKRLLMLLVHDQIALTSELHDLVVFDPAFASALRPLASAYETADRRLRATKDAPKLAVAIAEYRRAVDVALHALRPLHPPIVEKPSYESQVARLIALERALASLHSAIVRGDAVKIARAEHAVSVASVSSDSLANQRARRAAIVAYDAKIARVNALARRISNERARLQLSLR